MTKLNQIIAVEKGVKSRVKSAVTELYKTAQKPELFNGFAKSYEKADVDGEDLPAENKKVTFNAEDMLQSVGGLMAEYLTVTARKDDLNCSARADVVVSGKVLLPKAPITFLLSLEKELTDIKTFITHLPILDESEDWAKDSNSSLFKTEPTKTHRTKKIVKPIVMYPATDHHPAQTQLVNEDILAGYWKSIKHSGALPKPRKLELLSRVETFLNAVKEAREEANSIEEAKANSELISDRCSLLLTELLK